MKGPAKNIAALYRDFERAVAVYRTIEATDDDDGPNYDHAIDRACRLAHRIAVAPTSSISEMLLKIRVAAWDIGVRFERLEDLDKWKPTAADPGVEYYVLASLRSDLLALEGRGAA